MKSLYALEFVSQRTRADLDPFPGRFPPSTLESQLALEVRALLPTGQVIHVGTTSDGPVQIPERLAAWVRPAPGVDLRSFSAEVRARELPGVDLSGFDLTPSDLKAVANLGSAVRWLRLADVPAVKNSWLKRLRDLVGLEWLDLAGCTGVGGGLAPVATLQLRGLTLSRNTSLTATGLKPLASHPTLEVLDLGGSAPTSKTLKLLGGLTQLNTLDVSWDEESIRSRSQLGLYARVPTASTLAGPALRKLAALPNLRVLRLRHVWLQNASLRRIAELPALRVLDLSCSNMDDESQYPALSKFQRPLDLDLMGCMAPILEFLTSALPAETPRRLDLSGAELEPKHLEGLKRFTGLRRVRLPARVPPEQVHALATALPACNVESERCLGYVAFRVTDEARRSRVFVKWNELLADHRVKDDVVALRAPSLTLDLLFFRNGSDRAYAPVRAPRAYPTAEEALAHPLDIPVAGLLRGG